MKSSIDEKESLLAEIRQLYEQERRRVEFMGAVNDITLVVSSVLTLDELIGYLLNVLLETFGYYSVNVFLEEDSGDWVLTAGANAANTEAPIGDHVTADQTSIVGWVGDTGEIILANDAEKDPRYVKTEQAPCTKSELAVPVKTGDTILGVLDSQSSERDAFDETDQFTAQSLANPLAVSIANARLFEQTRDLAVLEERNHMAREIHDGVSFDVYLSRELSASGGFGMTAMRQRAGLIGGVFDVTSEAGHGTSISVRSTIR